MNADTLGKVIASLEETIALISSGLWVFDPLEAAYLAHASDKTFKNELAQLKLLLLVLHLVRNVTRCGKR